MNRDQLMEVLKEHKPIPAKRLGVVELALFGSAAHDKAEDESDVDIFVGFDGFYSLGITKIHPPPLSLLKVGACKLPPRPKTNGSTPLIYGDSMRLPSPAPSSMAQPFNSK